MKQSNVKAADLQEMLSRAGSTISDGAKNLGSSVSDWYSNLNPTVRNSVLSGLAGAGVGALASGGLAAATPDDPGNREGKDVMSNALLGALLGGTAGAALPAGIGLLRSKFPSESTGGVTSTIGDVLTPEPGNLFAFGGGVAGAALPFTRRQAPNKNYNIPSPLLHGVPPDPGHTARGAYNPIQNNDGLLRYFKDQLKKNYAAQPRSRSGSAWSMRQPVRAGLTSLRDAAKSTWQHAEHPQYGGRGRMALLQLLLGAPVGAGIGHLVDRMISGDAGGG